MNDLDVLVSLYSREHGKILAVSQKAKKNSQLMAALELFNEASFVLSKRRKYDQIYQVDSQTVFQGLRQNYDAYQTAHYLVNIIDKVYLPGEAAPDVYDLIFTSLKELSDSENNDKIKRYFQHRLLEIEGLLPLDNKVTPAEFELIIAEYSGSGGKVAQRTS